MRAARAIAMTAVVAACGGNQGTRLDKAGADRDEGAGSLARASLRLTTGEPEAAGGETDRFVERRQHLQPNPFYGVGMGGSIYGGDLYGGGMYGGVGYANWVVPQWSYSPPNRTPRYQIAANLTGAVEGTVTWVGAPPTKVASACGLIDNPTLRVGTDKAARGVIVYIEKVERGRAVPYYTRPVSVGGTLGKRGCALVPAAQIVAPLPGPITIHGDETRTKLRITADKSAKDIIEDLQEAGMVLVEAKPGVTRVDSADGKLAAAWVIGIDTPYYAITDDAGRYRIDELPPGSYELTFWQPPVAAAGPNGIWTYGAPVVVRRTVKVGGPGSKATQLSVALR